MNPGLHLLLRIMVQVEIRVLPVLLSMVDWVFFLPLELLMGVKNICNL
jgi:hypothetical protein